MCTHWKCLTEVIVINLLCYFNIYVYCKYIDIWHFNKQITLSLINTTSFHAEIRKILKWITISFFHENIHAHMYQLSLSIRSYVKISLFSSLWKGILRHTKIIYEKFGLQFHRHSDYHQSHYIDISANSPSSSYNAEYNAKEQHLVIQNLLTTNLLTVSAKVFSNTFIFLLQKWE